MEEHFADEEKLMEAHQYPELDSHRKKHDYMRKVLREFVQRFEANELNMELEFINFLKTWIVDHILTVDRKYGPFFSERGVS